MRNRLTKEDIEYLKPYKGEFTRITQHQCATIHRDYWGNILAIYNRVFKAKENCSACSSVKYMVLFRLATAFFEDAKLYEPKPEPITEQPAPTEPEQITEPPKKKRGRPKKVKDNEK